MSLGRLWKLGLPVALRHDLGGLSVTAHLGERARCTEEESVSSREDGREDESVDDVREDGDGHPARRRGAPRSAPESRSSQLKRLCSPLHGDNIRGASSSGSTSGLSAEKVAGEAKRVSAEPNRDEPSRQTYGSL
jgi:hypothetical protein